MCSGHKHMAGGGAHQAYRDPPSILGLNLIDTGWFQIVRSGTLFWYRVFLYKEVKGFAREDSAEVVVGPVACFCREEDDYEVFGQLFT